MFITDQYYDDVSLDFFDGWVDHTWKQDKTKSFHISLQLFMSL